MLKTDYDIPIFKDEDVADLNEYSNEMASALKTQLDKFGNPLVYKGEVATLEDLPSEAESGNIYSVTSENKNYIYNGTNWVEYSSTLDLTYLENNTKEVSKELKEVTENKRLKQEGKSEQAGEPTVDNPSKIRNIGDNINLAEYVENLWFNNTSLKFLNIENTYGFVAKVSTNTQYIINKKYIGNRFVVVSSSTYPQNNTDIVRIISASNHNLTQYKFNTQANEKYIFLGVYVGTDEEELKKAIKEVKIEEGSTATSYTPYGCGSIDYAIEDTSNNIFNKDTDIELDGQYRTYKSGNIATNQYYYGIKVKVEENREYKVFSYQDYSNLCYFDKDMNYLSGELFGKNAKATIFKTPSNCEYITLAVAKNGINEFSITEAKTIHFPLSKGQVIHKDDYIMNNKIHQNRKTYTITGNENWVLTTGTTNFLGIYLNDVIKDCVTNEYSINVQSNIATGVEYNNRWKNVNTVSCRANTLTLTLDNVTTLQEAKAYLKSQYANGTPVIVEYKLAEEIVTPLAKEQIEALYELQKAKYVDKMELTCLNEIKPTLTDIDKSLEESLLDVEKLLAMLSLNS